MTARLRPATAQDADAIAELWHLGWRDGHVGHVPDELAAHRGPEVFRWLIGTRLPHTTVAVVGDDLAGFVVVDGDEAEQVYAAARHRGTEVAGLLLGAAEAQIAEDHEVAWLAVVAGNARARRFYERQGWVDAGPFTYQAQVPGGTVPVPSHRYEKRVRPGEVTPGR